MKILINYINGGVGIMHVFDGADAQECIDKWKEINVGMYLNHRSIDDADIPTDYTYQDAWEDTGIVSVNMSKAREIHRDNLRVLRSPLLVALDVEYLKADEAGDTVKKAEVVAKKQALRDVTKHSSIDSAQTLDELKAAIPAVMNS